MSRWLQVAREALFVETERRLRARLNLGDGEAASLIRLMRSHFGDVSVARLLRANDRLERAIFFRGAVDFRATVARSTCLHHERILREVKP